MKWISAVFIFYQLDGFQYRYILAEKALTADRLYLSVPFIKVVFKIECKIPRKESPKIKLHTASLKYDTT